MSPDNSLLLQSAFPRLYCAENYRRHPFEFVSSLAFECGDGWTGLIYRLSAAITQHASAAGLDPVAVQVKEKYGELRIYVDGGDDVVDQLVDEAEAASSAICEVCGEPGTLRVKGWMKTRCEVCK
jgi:hypothetical protein